MTSTATVPEWVRPATRAVTDFRALAHAFARDRPDDDRIDGWVTAIGLVLDTAASRDAALAAMNRAVATRNDPAAGPKAAAIADTIAWLVGLLSRPPFELPRRDEHGQPVTADVVYAEREAADPMRWEPERREQERATARRQAARWAALADLADENP